MSHQLAGLRLNTGELWVVLNELNLGGGLLSAEGALVGHSDPDRTAMLRDGRATLLARGLLRVNGEGRVTLADEPRALIARSAHPDAAVWLMRTSGAGAPAQVYVALIPDGGVAYRPDASGVHDFIPIPDANALAALTLAEMSGLPACEGLRPRVWLAPTAILGPVAEGTEAGDGDNANVNALVGCGFSEADASGFIQAVAEAELRGALTGFALGRAGISLTWLGHASAIWTIRLDGESGLSLLRRCGGEAARQQAAAIAAEIAGRVWLARP